jgi:hypothetical protein
MPFDLEGARKAGYSDADIANYLASKQGFDVGGARKVGYGDQEIINHLSSREKPPEAGFSAKDIGVAGVRGALGVTKAITDVFGADNAASKKLAEYSSSMASLYTPERQKEIAFYERKAKEAEESGKPVEEIKAALASIKAAPLQATAEAVGSIIPNLASLFIPVVGEARGAALARSAYNTFIGILEGTGAVKGSIYDNVKEELIKNKVPEKEAERLAEQAQSYTGKNFDQIFLGAGIGAAAGKLGVEQLLTPKAGKLAQKAAAVGSEMFTEAGQASQEQIAANLAAKREGLDVDLMKGVAGAATREGVMGALGAGAVGITRPTEQVAPEAPPEQPTVKRGSDIIRERIQSLEGQPQTPETQRLLQELTQQLETVSAEETKIDGYKQEFSSLPERERQDAFDLLRKEQAQNKQLLDDPEALKGYAESQNLDVAIAEQQLRSLYQENELRQRAYSEMMQLQPPTAQDIEYVSDIGQLSRDQKQTLLGQAIEPIQTAVSEGSLNLDDAVRIVNKSGGDQVMQSTGLELLQNRDAELVENILEILRRQPPQTMQEVLDNAEFLQDVESIAQQSLDEQKELRQDIESLSERNKDTAEKYGIDLESEADLSDMISTLEMQLDELRNLSQNESVYDRIRNEIAEERTKQQIDDRERDKAQEEFSGVPDDILDKIDAHIFGQKLGVKYVKSGRTEFFEMPMSNEPLAAAARANSLPRVINELSKNPNPAIRLVADRMSSLKTNIVVGFPPAYSSRYSKAAGLYSSSIDTVFLRRKYARSEEVVAHEFVHALTVNAINNPTPEQKPIIDKLQKLYQHVKNELGYGGKTRFPRELYGLTNLKEFVAEANSNVNFQYQLAKIKYKNETAWGAFTRTIANLLGIANVSALTEVMALTEELTSKQATTSPKVVTPEVLPAKPPQAPPRTPVGTNALNTLQQMNRQVQPPSPGHLQRIRAGYQNAVQNPQLTAQSAKDATKRFFDKMETVVFSSDAALNNAIRRNIMASMAGMDTKVGQLLEVSLGQTMHADAIASLHMMEGKVVYDKKLHKWVAEKSDGNLVELANQVDKIAEKYGLTKEEAMLVAHTAFEAKRLRSISAANAAIDAQISALRREAQVLSSEAKAAKAAGNTDESENKYTKAEKKRAEARKLAGNKKIVHMTAAEINAGTDLLKSMPELNGLVDTWQTMRQNTADVLVESGLWSRDEADLLLDNIDYVPFYREEQIEQGKGPKEFIRGLQVKARDPRFKGSQRRVNDIFDNMARWMQYAVNRSVRNRSSLSLIDAAVGNGLGKKVPKPVRGGNNVNVWRDGKQEFYEMDDPLYVDAFRGLESVAIPALNIFSKLSNLLRQSVVMYPLFSVAQVPQDSFAAMFSSGLKPQYALRIPVLAVKEFIKTLSKKSQTHETLRKIGAVGVKDFSSAVARLDAEVLSGLKAPSGVKGKVVNALAHIAMSADNAVRQAVYEATLQAGKTQAEAMEKAFQVINFRNRGSSKLLALAGQVIPFFNAYLAAQHVAYKTITGVGISPQERNAALKTLAATTGSVMAMSLIYAMMNADDEDYLNKPASVRDRLLMIPGTGGLSIPLRMDLFTFPKVLTEHMYLLLTDKGYEDTRKFRDSMQNALFNAVASPTPVPQAIKPLVEVGINYNFFQGRPLVGTFQKGLELERQFNDSTSELAKLLGSTGMVSPIAADHLIRGMFGSVGGLVLYMTNPLLHNDPTVERPSLSLRDAMAALPGTSGFISREYETALKTDFYVLRDEVSKVANTINDMKNRSPQDIDDYLEKPGVEERYGLQKTVNKITQELTKIRKNIGVITNATDMSAKEKEEQIKDLRETERDLLKSIDVKELREMAKI